MTDDLDARTTRIRIHDSVRPIYDRLYGNSNIEQLPFPQIKDVFIFAACVGYQKKNRRPIPAGKRTDLRLEVFSDTDKQIMKAIALAATNDVVVLEKKPEERISGKVLTIVEEFAHGGIEELKSMLDQPGYTLYNLVDMIGNIDSDTPLV
ncbi:MAG: hypothetical protein ACTHMI_24025 [Mucilaginibacter sp.]